MKITPDILSALRKAIEDAGTQELFSKKCGVPRNYLSNYLNNRVQEITLENWLKLLPHLKELQYKIIEMEAIAEKFRISKCQEYEKFGNFRVEGTNDYKFYDHSNGKGIYLSATIPSFIDKRKIDPDKDFPNRDIHAIMDLMSMILHQTLQGYETHQGFIWDFLRLTPKEKEKILRLHRKIMSEREKKAALTKS